MDKYSVVRIMYTDILKAIDDKNSLIHTFFYFMVGYVSIVVTSILLIIINLKKLHPIFNNDMWILYLAFIGIGIFVILNFIFAAYKGDKVSVTNNAEVYLENVKGLGIEEANNSLCYNMSECNKLNVKIHLKKTKYLETAKISLWILVNYTIITPIIILIIIKF